MDSNRFHQIDTRYKVLKRILPNAGLLFSRFRSSCVESEKS
jgi:hypothetical protein